MGAYGVYYAHNALTGDYAGFLLHAVFIALVHNDVVVLL